MLGEHMRDGYGGIYWIFFFLKARCTAPPFGPQPTFGVRQVLDTHFTTEGELNFCLSLSPFLLAFRLEPVDYQAAVVNSRA